MTVSHDGSDGCGLLLGIEQALMLRCNNTVLCMLFL